MAKFVFPLKSLLAHRERVEHERQRDLAVAGAELAAAQAELQRVETGVRDALEDLRQNHLTGRIDLGYLAAHRRFMLAMQRSGATKGQAVKAAQAKVDAARKLLAEAAKQRKAIDTLREQQQARWADGQGRRESAALDEIAMQMVYHAGGTAGGHEAEASQ